MRKVIVLTALVLLPALSGPANADLTAIWDFGPNAAGYTQVVTAENVIGTPTLSLSGGDIDTNGKDGVGYRDAAGTYHNPGQGAAWDDVRVPGPDAEWVLTINTTGWEDMTIRWDYKSEEAPTFDLGYSVDGGVSWVRILNNQSITADWSWYPFSCDLSAISAIENRSSVQFRVQDFDRDPDCGNGRYVFDNLELTGVPEPCSIALLGIGALMALTRKRRSALKTKN